MSTSRRRRRHESQQFYEEHLNDYLNFHRPCGQVEIRTDAKGKQRCVYRRYETPWEVYRALPIGFVDIGKTGVHRFLRSILPSCKG